MSQDKPKKMDPRCPRKLDQLPCDWCPLAVQRLKALRHTDKELSEEEEDKLGGCKYAVNHQMANYCFFKLIEDYSADNKGFSDMEIAHFLNLPIDTIKKIEKKAIHKLQESKSFKEIINTHNGDRILEDSQD